MNATTMEDPRLMGTVRHRVAFETTSADKVGIPYEKPSGIGESLSWDVLVLLSYAWGVELGACTV